MAVTAIVPVKTLAQAKSRLAGSLAAPERRVLVAWMLRRVLDACRTAGAVDRVIVVAGDERAAATAARPGVEVLLLRTPGLAAALAAGDRAASRDEATLVVPADLPLATAADVEAVCALDAAVVVVPARDGGTGALLRRPPGVMATAFGPDSAAAHLRLAAAAGLDPVRLDLPRLAFDVDTPRQLRALSAWGEAG